MPYDGLFIHYLTSELNHLLNGKKINKIIQPNALDIILQIKGKNSSLENVTYNLLISSSLDMPRIYITEEKLNSIDTPKNFCVTLRKHIDRGIINKVYQIENDRVIAFDIKNHSELGDEEFYTLYFELMGRNSNLILVNNKNKIIDVIRRLPISAESDRLFFPKSTYKFPLRLNEVNPFLINENNILDKSVLQGCSNIVKAEFENSKMLIELLKKDPTPYIYKCDNKIDFYVLPLSNKEILEEFKSMNSMLDHYYKTYRMIYNDVAKNLKKTIKNKLIHLYNKVDNLELSIQKAYENEKYIHLGMLLQANLYLVKKGMDKVIINDYLNNSELVEITLDPTLEPSINLKNFFSKGKKAKNAIIFSKKQLEITNNEIKYLDTILCQIDFASQSELDEIKEELIKTRYLKPHSKNSFKKKPTQITKFVVNDHEVLVGKNNIQNNLITHTLSKPYDYWFHVKDMPGSHVLFRCNVQNYSMNEEEIRFCANLAASYSKAKTSSSVPVDYTQIKFIKKIPGLLGCEVTYSHQSTIYIDPKID